MKVFKLYGGTIELHFDEAKHLYSIDNKKVDGVTGALNVIAKPALMYWAVNMAIQFLQKALRAGQVYDEIQIQKLLEGAKSAHRIKKEDASDIGKLVHTWIEDYLQGKNPKPPVNEKMKNAVDSFLKWEKEEEAVFLESERVLYSKKYNYAGTTDFICRVKDGRVLIGDFKTSSGIWDEYWYQIAAYQQAYHEEFPDRKIDGGVIVRIGKDGTLDVKESQKGDYELDVVAFNSALALHRRQTQRKERAYQEKLKIKK